MLHITCIAHLTHPPRSLRPHVVRVCLCSLSDTHFKRFYGLLSSDAEDGRERSEEERDLTPKPSRKNTAETPAETAPLLVKRRARPPHLAQAELTRLAAKFARGITLASSLRPNVAYRLAVTHVSSPRPH
ncbi:uncharacterized protein BXZ73DRAFT_106460 [Epithele typhae]|uniref:uncharacterized protein n=1 Tax=Epithele typhae TaxID=378194 RepID=UPI0020082A8D|nr:uncharacterized protein BXZ73DRAFT_106460 [Epithele typhae]KAH9914790.1 hypothetical protein BXZ73DRAFT_106460 [Epithele typhae]